MDDKLISISNAKMKCRKSEDGLSGHVEALGIRFANQDEPDLEGDFFNADTYFGKRQGDGVDATLNHTFPIVTKDEKVNDRLIEMSNMTFENEMKADKTELGIIASHVLDLRDSYEKFVFDLVEQGALSWSSGAIGHTMRSTPVGKAHAIKRWDIGEWAYTPTPAEPRLPAIMPIKSLIYNPLDVTSGPENPGKKTAKSNGDTEMDEKQIKDLIDAAIKAAGDNQPDFKQIIADTIKSVLATQDNPIDEVGIAEIATKAIEAYVDKLPAKAKGLFIVADETDKEIEAHPHQFGVKLQAVRAKALGEDLTKVQKAILGQNESVPQEGAFLVGTEQETAIEKKIHDGAPFSSRSTNRTIGAGANAVDFYGRKENSRAAGSRHGGIRGYRVAEGGTITASDMDFYKYTLKPEKYAVLAYATNEVMRDAALLQSEISEAAGDELQFMINDDQLNGSAAGYPQGILNAACLVTVPKEAGQAATTLLSQNIVNMWARMWSKSKLNAVWFINTDVTPQLHLLNTAVGTGGQLVYMPPGGLSASPYGSLYGRPVVETEFNATLGTVGDIVLADWSQYKLANMGAIQSASSMHVQFLTDQMAFRFTVEYDGQATWEAALTPFKGTNTLSPFVALATRS